MQHAIWVKKTGEEEYVTIKEVKEALGEAASRRETFKCPSKKCGLRMIPVYPKQVRIGGKEAHIDHFRANPIKHKKGCEGDGAREEIVDVPAGDVTDTKPIHAVVTRSSFPNRYVRQSRSPRDVVDKVINGDGEPGQNEPIDTDEPKVGGVRSDEHKSEHSTGHIKDIVKAYEESPKDLDLSQIPLKLPQCPARNYKDALMDVAQAVDIRGLIAESYIYKGAYSETAISFNKGISIYFQRPSHIKLKIGVYVKPELGPDVHRKEIEELLARAAREKNATVYVFGRFKLHQNYKYSLEIEAFGDLWITFPTGGDG